MADNPNPFLPSSPPPSPPSPSSSAKTNLPMLYYGLVIVGTAAIVLAIYNLIVIKWCAHRRGSLSNRDTRFVEIMRTSHQQSLDNSNRSFLSSYTYKKDMKKKSNKLQEEEGGDYECAVCLSAFEEGEEVRELPRCSHSFHAPCIDMWLYSHYDCPLCRTLVNPQPVRHSHRHMLPGTPENSQEGLLASGNISV